MATRALALRLARQPLGRRLGLRGVFGLFVESTRECFEPARQRVMDLADSPSSDAHLALRSRISDDAGYRISSHVSAGTGSLPRRAVLFPHRVHPEIDSRLPGA